MLNRLLLYYYFSVGGDKYILNIVFTTRYRVIYYN